MIKAGYPIYAILFVFFLQAIYLDSNNLQSEHVN